MSKDNTVIILRTTNHYYVANTTNAECLTYNPDVCPIGQSKPYFSREFVEQRFEGSVPFEGKIQSRYNVYRCNELKDALECADQMEDEEEEDTGWSSEYGIHYEAKVYPEDIP